MGDYIPPWGQPVKPPTGPAAPKPSKYVNTPYGPVLRTQLGKGPTVSPGTAKYFKPGQVAGGYIDPITLECIPVIPNPIKSTGGGKDGDGDGDGGNTKTATTSNFIETIFDSLPDYGIEGKLSLIGLTANEILQVSHRENFYTTNENLNDNILDLVETLTSFAPSEIIKLQTPNLQYFQNNLSAYDISLPNNSSIVTISIPNYKANSLYKVEVQSLAPRVIANDTVYDTI